MQIIQAAVTIYVFIAILIMIYKGFTLAPDNNYMDKVRHRALVWPLECLFIIRRYFNNRLLKALIIELKKEQEALDFAIDEVVFYVKDEDREDLVHKEVTNLEFKEGKAA